MIRVMQTQLQLTRFSWSDILNINRSTDKTSVLYPHRIVFNTVIKLPAMLFIIPAGYIILPLISGLIRVTRIISGLFLRIFLSIFALYFSK